MKQFEIIYEENKKLDEMFDKLYDNHDIKTIEKNIVELLVEIGELANETRCFKYWSNKKPSDKEIILDEYADCFIMTLYFCNMVNVSLDEDFIVVNETDVVTQFKELYKVVSKLDCNLDKNIIKEILSNIVNLGKLLNFTNQDIIDGCMTKINRNKQRFEMGF
ncbi:MAG: dUTP diphosphatase [Bacilli bacterium]|nr:dUTP diphosphatase [Bacilli bacterium]MDD4718857.1 dUTP diphosphatase [Bacilli bacterium]